KSGYSSGYLRKDIGPTLWHDLSVALREPVSKTNFKAALERNEHYAFPSSTPSPIASDLEYTVDWGEAIDVSTFVGRTQEQALLSQWLISDRCRFILLLGMGGIGKTALSIKVSQSVQAHFEFVIWRSLRNAPPPLELFIDVIKILSRQQDVDIPKTVEEAISQLLQFLRKQCCLLVLDNADAILQAGDSQHVSRYRPGYEGYGRLFQQVGEIRHQSCLMVTSREQPQELATKFGQQLPVRCFGVGGLSYQDGQALFGSIGHFRGTERKWQSVINRYGGNPLALKIVASFVSEVFVGDLDQFLTFLGESSGLFDDIQELLEQQFQRLSPEQRDIMMWIAINREPVGLIELREDLAQFIPPYQFLQVLGSLKSCSLIEKVDNSLFTQQPVVMEYVINCLIDQVGEQLDHRYPCKAVPERSPLQKYALMQAQAKDYVKEAQQRLILKPVLDLLMVRFGDAMGIEEHVQSMLYALQAEPVRIRGYAVGNLINLLRQLEVDFSGYNFSRLSVWQADLQGLVLHNVDFSGADLSKSRFSQTFGWIPTLAFSPDGKFWVAGDSAGVVHLWFERPEQTQIALKAPDSYVFALAVSPDSQLLVSSDMNGTLLWDVSTQQCLHTINAHTQIIWSTLFSKDGQWFVSASEDGTIKRWDCQTGQCLQTLDVNSSVRSVALTSDQRYLVSGSEDNQVRLWDLAQGICIRTFEGHAQTVWTVDISPDDRYIASGGNDCVVKVWDIDTGACLHNFEGHTLQIWDVAFSPNGNMIASGSMDQTIRLWNLKDKRCGAYLQGHSSMVMCVAFSADGKILASGGADRLIKHWDIARRVCAKTWSGYRNTIWSVEFSPDGDTVASSSIDGRIRLWQVADGQCVQILKHPAEVHAIAFSPDGKHLVSGNLNTRSTLKVWDLQQGTCLSTIPAHVGKVNSLCIHPEGTFIASGGDDKNVHVFDLNHQRVEKILPGHQAIVWTVAFSQDGKFLASGSFDQTIKIWDVNSWQCLRTLSGHGNALTTIVFHPSLPIVATASSDSTVKVWELETGMCCCTLSDHPNVVMGIAFSPGGKTFATGSYDKTIRIWDVASWKCQAIFQANSLVHAVAFSPDGQTLVSAGDNGTLQLWNLVTQQCIQVIRLPDLYAGMNIHEAKGLSDAQRAMLISLGAREEST
ncbi:MAG: NB-ARC domain-containing protein, partial [Cyanophyceae cyanobacterium]